MDYCQYCGQDLPDVGATCPNCGGPMPQRPSKPPWQGDRPAPRFGPPVELEPGHYPLEGQPPPVMQPTRSGPMPWHRVLAITLFVLIGIPSCLCGGCFLMISGSAIGSGSQLGVMALSLALLAVFGLLLTFLVRSHRKQ